jgi:predicted RNA-binding protein with EMAP domain
MDPIVGKRRSDEIHPLLAQGYLDTQASLGDIVETLTRIGLDVEGVEDAVAKYRGFVVARVIKAKPHPNADRLHVCMVDTGSAPVRVVCGAPNARTGMKSARRAFDPPPPRRASHGSANIGLGAPDRRRSNNPTNRQGGAAGPRPAAPRTCSSKLAATDEP